MNGPGRDPRVLVVEDDNEIAQVLQRSLRLDGYDVRIAGDGEAALDQAAAYHPDLVILDLGLPKIDGIEVARRLRAADDVPILMLTARDAVESRVEGLDSGADDYLIKPFERQELLARLRALLRRRPPRGSASLVVSDLALNPDTHEVTRGDRAIELTQREFELLEYLMRNERIVVPRQRLLEEVWGYDPFATTNTIEVFVSNLRRKLEAGGEARLLHTIPGAGDGPRALPTPEPVARGTSWVLAPIAIRWRLAIVSAALTFVILAAFAVVIGQVTAARVRSDYDNELAAAVDNLSDRIAVVGDPVRGNFELLTPNLQDYGAAGGATIRVLTRSGQILGQTRRAPNFGILVPRSARIGALRVETRERPVPVRNVRGLLIRVKIQYARPVSDVEAPVSRVRLFLAGGVLGGTLLALLGGLIVGRRAVAPVAALTGAARDIAETRDPGRSLPRSRADDEVAELGRTLQLMLDNLEASRTETEDALSRQRQFVADASHDLRTPPTSFLAKLGLLAEVLDGKGREAAESALR